MTPAISDAVEARVAAVAAHARHDLMACLWGSGLAYAEIGRLLGVDHTSVMAGVRKELRA